MAPAHDDLPAAAVIAPVMEVVEFAGWPLPHEVPPFPGERKSCLNITGVPGHVVENVSLSGLRISFPGGGTQEDAQRTVPEMRDHYPEYHMFGTLPAYGAYLRHMRGAIFENATIEFGEPDLRPAIVGEDVEELELANVRADGATEAALISLRDARQVYVHGCRPLREVALFLRVEGAGSENILLPANDLRRAKQDCLVVEGASAEAVTLA